MRYRNCATGVVVNVLAGKALVGQWEPADRPKAATSDVCSVCGFVAKSKAGLGAHRRRHDS